MKSFSPDFVDSFPKLQFTGERMIPEINKGATLYYEHILRYLFASKFVKGKKVLDIASGSGYGSYILSRNAKRVIGIDKSSQAIDYSKRKYANIDNLDFVQQDFGSMFRSKEKYNVIVAFEILEHVKNQQNFLNIVKSLLTEDGVFLLSTPNVLTYPKGNRYHIKELDFKEFSLLLNKYFKNVQVLYQFFLLANTLYYDKAQKKTVNLGFDEFVEESQKVFTKRLSSENSQYFIAVCTGGKPLVISQESLLIDEVDLLDFSLGINKVNEIVRNNRLTTKQKENAKEIQRLNRVLDEITSSKTFKFWQLFVKYRQQLFGLLKPR